MIYLFITSMLYNFYEYRLRNDHVALQGEIIYFPDSVNMDISKTIALTCLHTSNLTYCS